MSNRTYKLDVGYLPNQDARYIRLIKYESDGEETHRYVARLKWDEFQDMNIIEPTLFITGLDGFRIDIDQ